MGSKASAFSLVELLMVAAIVAVLLGLMVPAASNLQNATKLTQATQMVADAMNLSRDTAAARNAVIELALIRENRPGSPTATAAFQSLSCRLVANDGTTTPLQPKIWLPGGIVVAAEAELSNVFQGAMDEAVLRFRPNGEFEPITAPETQHPWFLTLIFEKDAGKPREQLTNFATIAINPFTSRPFTFRP